MNEREFIEEIGNSVANDLSYLYRSLGREELKESFYWFIISSNPKFYSISGIQHYLGSGFVAARLSHFLEFNEYDIAVSFLGGVFHDFNKWYVSLEDVRKDVYEELATTKVYDTITEFLGVSKAEEAFIDAVEIGLKLESGGLPRKLQRIGEIVKIADILTGSRECWNISYCINKVLSLGEIRVDNVLPVVIGKQRPIVSLVSETIEKELKNLGAIPFVSTSEGMMFLVKKKIDVESVYDYVAKYVVASTKTSENLKQKTRTRRLNIYAIKDFLDGRRSLATYSRTYSSIAGYGPETIEGSFEKAIATPESLRLFIVVLANIYRKDPNKKEREYVRLKRFISVLQLPEKQLERIEKITKTGDMLRELYSILRGLDEKALYRTAKKAKEFIINEMEKYRGIDVDLLVKKLSVYINIGCYDQIKTFPERNEKELKVCSICREPAIVEKSLTSFLQELKRGIIKGINISEMFHPDIQGNPEKVGSIEQIKKSPVCEMCYFEAITAPRQIGYMDGLWASVLQYYPAMSIDLLNVIKNVIKKILKANVNVIPDYMTNRIIVSAGSSILTREHLRTSLDIWLLLGGNLVMTTTALGSAFTGTSLPIELEVTDVVIEEAVAEYMNILERAKREGKYIRFTREIRYWLYKTLRDYVSNLELKKGLSKTTSISFSRSGLQVTGFATIDSYSLVLKQS